MKNMKEHEMNQTKDQMKTEDMPDGVPTDGTSDKEEVPETSQEMDAAVEEITESAEGNTNEEAEETADETVEKSDEDSKGKKSKKKHKEEISLEDLWAESEEQEAPEAAEEKEKEVKATPKKKAEDTAGAKIFSLRTTANREDQVMDFVASNVLRKKMAVYSLIKPHGMRGYIFVEAETRTDAEQACFDVPYARGILPHHVEYAEIEHMLEQVKVQMNIKKNDIVEIISGPFKRENAKVTRIDQQKEEVVVELLEAAVPIPITVKMDAIRVIRRDEETTETQTVEEELEEL